MSYVGDLDRLVELLGAGMDPMAGLQRFDAIQEAQRARIAEKRATVDELVGGLGATTLESAVQGVGLEQLFPQLQASAVLAGKPGIRALTSPQFTAALDALYDDGRSLAAPAPDLAPEDISGIFDEVGQMAAQGLDRATIRDTLTSRFSMMLPSDLYSRVAPRIHMAIDAAYRPYATQTGTPNAGRGSAGGFSLDILPDTPLEAYGRVVAPVTGLLDLLR